MVLLAGLTFAAVVALVWSVAAKRRTLAERESQVAATRQERDDLVQLRNENRRLREQMQHLAGAAVATDPVATDPAAEAAARERYRKYGDIPGEKIALIEAIRVKYARERAIAVELAVVARSEEAARKLDGLQSAERADLQEALTPDELFEYELRNSIAAKRAEAGAGSLILTEGEFRDLVRLELEWQQFQPAMAALSLSPESETARQIANVRLLEEGRRLLGDERFRTVLSETRGDAKTIAEILAKHPDVPPNALFDVFLIRSKIVSEFMGQQGLLQPAERMAAGTAMQEEIARRARPIIGGAAWQDLEKTNLLGFARRDLAP